MAAKSKGIGERHSRVHFSRLVRHIVQITIWVGLFIVDRRVDPTCLKRLDTDDRLYRSGGARGTGSYRVPLQVKAGGRKLQAQARATIGGRAYSSRVVDIQSEL